MSDIVRSERDGLKIYVDVDGPVNARDVANILAALDRAFFRFARDEMRVSGARLRIAETGTGSWWALLMAGKELYDLSQSHPDLIPIFAQNIDTTYRILTEQDPEETKKHFVDLLRDLAKSGKQIGARAIEVAGGIRTRIEAMHFDELIHWKPRQVRGIGRAAYAAVEEAIPMLSNRGAMETAGQLAQSGNLFGTVFWVDNTWYARPEGMSGVLLPLTLSASAKELAEHGSAYQIGGQLLRSPQGYPIGIQVVRLTPINSKGRSS